MTHGARTLLLWTLFWALALTALRYVLSVLILKPFTESRLGAPKKPAAAWEVVELLARRPHASQGDWDALSRRLKLREPELREQRAAARRYVKDQLLRKKILESGWQAAYYACSSLYGIVVLVLYSIHTKSTLEWMQHDGSDADMIWLYYYVSFGYYLHASIALFYEQRKKDFVETLVHHAVTLMLLSFSWANNLVLIGSVLIILHDLSDPLLHSAKIFNYVRAQRVCDTLFVLFAVSFAAMRLYVLPVRILAPMLSDQAVYSILAERSSIPHVYYLVNAMLFALMSLHIFWFYLILRVVHRFVLAGKAEKDVRSEDSD
jgi:ceramide synthetase